jgi:hypothetical protein
MVTYMSIVSSLFMTERDRCQKTARASAVRAELMLSVASNKCTLPLGDMCRGTVDIRSRMALGAQAH